MTTDPLDALRLPVLPIEPRPEFADALLRRIEARPGPLDRQTATIRYFVADLEASVDFYCRLLDFEEELRPSPVFAMLYRGDLRLLLSVPGGAGAVHTLPDGTLTPLHVVMATVVARDGTIYATTIYPFTLLRIPAVP